MICTRHDPHAALRCGPPSSRVSAENGHPGWTMLTPRQPSARAIGRERRPPHRGVAVADQRDRARRLALGAEPARVEPVVDDAAVAGGVGGCGGDRRWWEGAGGERRFVAVCRWGVGAGAEAGRGDEGVQGGAGTRRGAGPGGCGAGDRDRCGGGLWVGHGAVHYRAELGARGERARRGGGSEC